MTNSLKGKILVAMPNLFDDVFGNSVIYLTEHAQYAGAIGVIINKNLPAYNKSRLVDFDLVKYNSHWNDLPFYFGGPVKLNNGFILHSSVENQLKLSGGELLLSELSRDHSKSAILCTAGYCIWEREQLETELFKNHWLVIDTSLNQLLYDYSAQERYSAALKVAGVNWANFDPYGIGNA